MATESQCKQWADLIRSKAMEFYDHQINEAENLKQLAIGRGEDPEKVEVSSIATINYPKLIDNTNIAKTAALQEANRRGELCLKEAAPDWMTEPQKITDYAMAVALLPYIELTHNYAAAKVDLNEIYKGRAFGGSDAVMPKIREQVFNAIGISGDAAKVLSDPVNTIRGAVEDVIKGANLPEIKLPIPPLKLPKFW